MFLTIQVLTAILASMIMRSAYSLSQVDWMALLADCGASPFVLPFLLDGIYRSEAVLTKHVSPLLLEELRHLLDFSLPTITAQQEAPDGTVKFQLRFIDGLEVETVLIPFHKRFTVCLSTQVGCGMNCSFCYTGTQGLKRNLTSGEIVGQYLAAKRWLKIKTPRALAPSIVFMGQGEPLHNASEVEQAIRIFTDPKLVDLGHRQLTLSTVGYLPGLQRLRGFPKVNVALSLHSPFEEERRLLIPVSERFPLTAVLQELDQLPLLPRQFITYEYLMIRDFNMSLRHAEGLADLLGHRKALVNLIPFNPFPGARWQRPSMDEVDVFRAALVERKLRVMVRTTKGAEILAACGQLKVNKLAREHATH